MKKYFLLLSIWLVAAGFAFGQGQTGQIFGIVSDASGAVIPDVKVTITSPALQQPQTVQSSSDGAYRFPGLPIGTYSINFEAAGYSTVVQKNIDISIGFNAQINGTMQVGDVKQTVNVTTETPVVDTQSTDRSSHLDLQTLQELPSGRGQYNMTEESPGVAAPTKDVGGATNGQQTSFVSRGGDQNQTRFYMDGVDLGPAGSSTAMWVDVDSIQETQITAGGADASVESSGLTINMVSKSGSDQIHGTAHYYAEDQTLEANNIDAGLRPVLALPTASPGNPLQSFADFGAEIGGPVKKSKLWYWVDYAQQIITSGDDKVYKTDSSCAAVAANQTAFPWGQVRACTNSDPVYLKHFAYKLAYSPFKGNTFTFENRYDVKEQQHFQFTPLRPLETTIILNSPYNALSRGPRYWDAGWPALWRFSDQQVVNDHLVVEIQLLHFVKSNLMNLQTPAQQNTQVQFEQSTSVFAKSYAYSQQYEPMNTLKGTINYFRPAFLGGNNTFKIGADYARYENYETANEGGGVEAIFNSGTGAPFSAPLAANFYRPSIYDAFLYQTSAWIQDTYARKRLTLNLGIRYDRQDDSERPQSVAGSPFQGQLDIKGVPFNYLPAVAFAGSHSPVVWNTFAPRLGATYDLFGKGKTILKASYDRYYDMRFAGQLAAAYDTISTVINNQATANSFVQLPWTDLNHDGVVQVNEVDTSVVRSFGGQYNPKVPGPTTSPNSVDPNIKDPSTDEVVAGVSQEIGAGFGLDVSYIYRHYSNFIWNRVNGISSANYVAATYTPAAGACPATPAPMKPTQCASVQYFNPSITLGAPFTIANEPGYTRTYQGLDIALRKNMSHNWMFQGAYTYQGTVQNWSGPDSYQDPTNIAQQNGKQYAPSITGYTIPVATNARWIARAGGQYISWKGISFSGTGDFRQGYPIINTQNVATRLNSAPAVAVIIDSPGAHRFHRLATVDIRIDRKFSFWNERLSLTPAMDLYNIFNASTVLAQQPNQNASTANRIGAIVGPRIARFGVLARF